MNLGRNLRREAAAQGPEAAHVLQLGHDGGSRTQALLSLETEDSCLAREAQWPQRKSGEEPGLEAKTFGFLFFKQLYQDMIQTPYKSLI